MMVWSMHVAFQVVADGKEIVFRYCIRSNQSACYIHVLCHVIEKKKFSFLFCVLLT